mmetsp:Transcript_43413/g.116641  ORF Transcript_43413/g.116641 Transcript_43413/m.116641 type:complete len:336 (+) Transcript_43413:458-1465(+)
MAERSGAELRVHTIESDDELLRAALLAWHLGRLLPASLPLVLVVRQELRDAVGLAVRGDALLRGRGGRAPLLLPAGGVERAKLAGGVGAAIVGHALLHGRCPPLIEVRVAVVLLELGGAVGLPVLRITLGLPVEVCAQAGRRRRRPVFRGGIRVLEGGRVAPILCQDERPLLSVCLGDELLQDAIQLLDLRLLSEALHQSKCVLLGNGPGQIQRAHRVEQRVHRLQVIGAHVLLRQWEQLLLEIPLAVVQHGGAVEDRLEGLQVGDGDAALGQNARLFLRQAVSISPTQVQPRRRIEVGLELLGGHGRGQRQERHEDEGARHGFRSEVDGQTGSR